MAAQSGNYFASTVRAMAITTVCLALTGCQTKMDEAFDIGDAAAPALATTNAASGSSDYVDPMVVVASQNGAVPSVGGVAPTAAKAFSQQAPEPASASEQFAATAPANLGELTMQPTAVNAQHNSIFSVAAAPVAATVETGTNGASIVPSAMPSRRIQAAQKSLFSAPAQMQPIAVEDSAAAVPAQTAARAAPADELPLWEQDARPTGQRAVLSQNVSPRPVGDPAEPLPQAELAKVTETAASPKRRWLPSLPQILRGGKATAKR